MAKEVSGDSRIIEKELAYDRISDDWDDFMCFYDANRRIKVLVDEFLGEGLIRGKKCLDAGCGLGYFSEALLKHTPLSLHAFDIAPKLVDRVSKKIPNIHCFAGSIFDLPNIVNGELFDVVLCSDVIEHTHDPKLATKKLTKTVAPGGLLSISVPNKRWKWLVDLANIMGLRKNYEGYENYPFPREFKVWIEEEGFDILRCEGIHTIPFRLFPKRLLRMLDEKMRNYNYSYAFNLAILARKNA